MKKLLKNELVVLILIFFFLFIIVGRPIVQGDGWGYFGIYRTFKNEGTFTTDNPEHRSS